MPSFQDSVVIFILALILVGPKNLPKLARQLGKLMAEFRRASNEFRMQMEDELRVEEQKEHEAKVAALAGPVSETPSGETIEGAVTESTPIAEAGSLKMMPPSTGLPTEAGSYPTPDFATAEHTEHQEITSEAGISSEEPREEIHELVPADTDADHRHND
ncbi:twin-arginine translocase TatA/TatE family subunit [Terriglobus sp. TAA 43]|uniref:twin-arginine translocase TatA/TatE family subunit n=1 Tax=Terriglobus sp. TAA 43 TaxID=278961 RepID=UPI00068E9ED7|nr:twin-arginine translocase TatA/TatE family subunit [Terriglobus sp. TAA 43]